MIIDYGIYSLPLTTVHDLLPTARIRNRYNAKESAACSECKHPNETWLHILSCQAEGNQTISKKIRADIFRLLDDIIPADDRHLLKMTISQALGAPYGDISELSSTQRRIYEKQKQIGWNAFLKGFWCNKWATMRILCLDETGYTVDWRL